MPAEISLFASFVCMWQILLIRSMPTIERVLRQDLLMLADLSAPQSIQVCMKEVVPSSFLEVLSLGCAHIHQLSLYCLMPSVLSSLKPRQCACKVLKRVCPSGSQLGCYHWQKYTA